MITITLFSDDFLVILGYFIGLFISTHVNYIVKLPRFQSLNKDITMMLMTASRNTNSRFCSCAKNGKKYVLCF